MSDINTSIHFTPLPPDKPKPPLFDGKYMFISFFVVFCLALAVMGGMQYLQNAKTNTPAVSSVTPTSHIQSQQQKTDIAKTTTITPSPVSTLSVTSPEAIAIVNQEDELQDLMKDLQSL